MLFTSGMRFLGTRFSQLWLLILLPFVSFLFFKRISEGNFIETFLIIYICLVQTKYSQIIPVGLFISLAGAFYVGPNTLPAISFLKPKTRAAFSFFINVVSFVLLVNIFIRSQKSFPWLAYELSFSICNVLDVTPFGLKLISKKSKITA